MKKSDSGTATTQPARLRDLTDQLRQLETRLRSGGGPDKIDRQHQQGKLTARERIDLLLDKDSFSQEIGLLVAYDRYGGGAPAAGVVTVVGRVEGREVVVVANDATVKAGSWWPETIKKILRAQEIAMRCRVPIVYLVAVVWWAVRAEPRPPEPGEQPVGAAAALAGAGVARFRDHDRIPVRRAGNPALHRLPPHVRKHGRDPLRDHGATAASHGADADQDGAALAVQPEVLHLPAGVQRELVTG